MSVADWNERDGEDIQLVEPAAISAFVEPSSGSEQTVDELINAYELHEAVERAARSARLQIVAALAARAPRVGDSKTSRVRGDRRRAKIEFPEDAWEQSRLKEAWHSF